MTKHVNNTDEDTIINDQPKDEKDELKKYRIEWHRDAGRGAVLEESVIAYFRKAHDAAHIANALELISEGYRAKAVLLNEDSTAAVVALGVTAALDDVAAGFKSEGWKHKELSVNRTKAAREFCVRVLISRDLSAIENELRKRFAEVDSICCSEGDEERRAAGMPNMDELGTWPNAEGLHEWVCLLKMRMPQVEQNDLPEFVTVQWAVYWTEGQDSAFEEATGKSLNEATDEEALAYTATDNAFLELLSHELGGEELASHCELCNDRLKWIGQPWRMRLTGKIKGYTNAGSE